MLATKTVSIRDEEPLPARPACGEGQAGVEGGCVSQAPIPRRHYNPYQPGSVITGPAFTTRPFPLNWQH